MNGVAHRTRAVTAVTLPSCLRRRRTAASSPSLCLSQEHAACASAPARYVFTSSLLSKLGDSVASKVSQLAESVWLADEKLVTEPRRKFEPQRVANTSLAERLAAQRNVRRCLVPTSIKVDKSRQYVEFTWPKEAVEAMRSVSLKTHTPDVAESPKTSTGKSSSPAASSQVAGSATASVDHASARDRSSAPCPSPRLLCVPPGMPLRTRALAEYLRAYTPSTDGALGDKDIVIYGRRGIAIVKVIPVGNYALRFVFSDGHSGGIYSYEYLYYLTSPTTKYGLMRGYITELRQRRKSRDPPKRSPSIKYANLLAQNAATAAKH
ncbi:putative Protein (DUF971) [Leishmania shawi]|uniref:Gamma-butyrobetaine hydroxylase-like N-terminal domain-containing protein n=1 Tax=Leishmania shawi TaxID=5680 RepID=A0AAW3CBN6_9TRYP